MKYTTDSLREKWFQFWEEKQHKIIPSASVLPENDPTALFHNAGMHPLVPFLMGQKHPEGIRLANVQKCIRTGDIDEVGDATHLTFFEMLGNWSLGDYFKKEQIAWSFEFLTEVLELPIEKLAFSVFAGNDNAPKDEEAAKAWIDQGISKERIAYLGTKENWWAKGETGPCGPDSEMFYWTGDEPAPENFQETHEDPRWVEIWNDVFMEFDKNSAGIITPLPQQNIDTGMGLERTVAILNGYTSVYQIDNFTPIMQKISDLAENPEIAKNPIAKTPEGTSARIIADHIRSATVLLGDRIIPSNLDQGYILRRLIRRAIRHARKLNISENFCVKIATVVIETLQETYPELNTHKQAIFKELELEENQFQKTLEKGETILFNELKEIKDIINFIEKNSFSANLTLLESTKNKIQHYLLFKPFERLFDFYENNLQEKISPEIPLADKKPIENNKEINLFIKEEIKRIKNNLILNGNIVFNLYETYGFPLEMTDEIAQENGFHIDKEGFKEAEKKHQAKSKAGSEQKFSGGLGDRTEDTVKLHTATHLMHAALKKVLGDHVEQRGSNITPERLRFDFSHPEKVTPEQIAEVEKIVNEAIKSDAKVECIETTVEKAKAQNAIGLFENKYGDKVKMYTMGEHSKEICGGPHVKHLGELGTFKIKKEQASSRGIRRIKAILK